MRGEVLPVDSCEGPRWRAALEILQAGGHVAFRGVQLTLHEDGPRGEPRLGRLQASVTSQWSAANLTEVRALEDLARGRAIVDSLVAESADIRQLANKRRIVIELVDDYGMGSMLIATLDGDQIEWGHAPWRH